MKYYDNVELAYYIVVIESLNKDVCRGIPPVYDSHPQHSRALGYGK